MNNMILCYESYQNGTVYALYFPLSSQTKKVFIMSFSHVLIVHVPIPMEITFLYFYTIYILCYVFSYADHQEKGHYVNSPISHISTYLGLIRQKARY